MAKTAVKKFQNLISKVNFQRQKSSKSIFTPKKKIAILEAHFLFLPTLNSIKIEVAKIF